MRKLAFTTILLGGIVLFAGMATAADEFPQTPIIGLSDTNFTFSAILGGPNPGTQVLSIYNAGDGILNWEAAADCNWLTAEPNNGSSTGEPNDVILSVNTSGLDYGTYDCNLTISDPYAANNPQIVQVQLTINECYAGMADYSEWVAVGKPLCWCYLRQCHGDADGKKQGTIIIGYHYVGSKDLDVLSVCWLVRNPPQGPGIVNLPPVNGVPVACADFDHKKQGNAIAGFYRCGSNDLDEMSRWWRVMEPVVGPGTDPNCLPGNLTPGAKPSIEYRISPCGGRGLSATEQLDETRFTVTVEGRYIHLEDMMVANCCPKKLWLEMTVEDNLITVYEKEEGGVCLCICDYPVTATLGPFEPGTYTFEVYEDWGGFIGSTTVIIE